MPVEETAAKLKEEAKEFGTNGDEVARYLIDWLMLNPLDEVKITAKGKSIEGCLRYAMDRIEEEGKFKRIDTRRGINNTTREEEIAFINEYYGLGGAHLAEAEVQAEPPAEGKAEVYTAADETSLFGDDGVAKSRKEETPAKMAPASPAEKDIMSLSMDDFF